MASEAGNSGVASSNRPILLTSVLILVVMSWVGALDKLSEDYVNESLTKATFAFGTARAINGAVSIAQSTTISVGVGAAAAVAPGEILDPVNDLVEDYSSVMKLAIISLVIQKTLLAVISESLFKVLLTLSGLALIACLFLKFSAPVNLAFKIFVSLVVLRFALVVVVMLNGLVNQAFIDEKRDEVVRKLEILPGEIEHGLADSGRGSMQNDLGQIQRDVEAARGILEISKEKLNAAKTQRSLIARLNPFKDDPDYDLLVVDVDKAQATLDTLLVNQCDAARRAASESADAVCEHVSISVRSRVLAASIGKSISAVAKGAASAIDVSMLRQKVESAVEDMITSMSLFVLQTMLLPLLFLFLLSKGLKSIWGMDWREVPVSAKLFAARQAERAKRPE